MNNTQMHYDNMQQHQNVTLGTVQVQVHDRDFLHGFEEGYEMFQVHHTKEECIDASMFLFLLRNGWGTGHSEMWMTGYIMGWLAALYGQEEGQFALSRYDQMSFKA